MIHQLLVLSFGALWTGLTFVSAGLLHDNRETLRDPRTWAAIAASALGYYVAYCAW